MHRRDALSSFSLGFLAAGAVACAPKAALAGGAESAPAGGSESTGAGGHHHHVGAHGEVAGAAAHCLHAGEACQAHCVALLADGDASMGDCLKAVVDMLATAKALHTLAHAGSALTPQAAALAEAAAAACEKECAKHAATHATCKACQESCAALIAAIG